MNLFGMKSASGKRNPMAALLQPNLLELLGGGEGDTPPMRLPAMQETPSQAQPATMPGTVPMVAPPPVTQPSGAQQPVWGPEAPLIELIGKPKVPPIAGGDEHAAMIEKLSNEAKAAKAQKGGGLKEFMTTPLWGDKSMLMNKREQGAIYDWLNTPQWFIEPKGGQVPGTGEVPTKLNPLMVPEKPEWVPPGTPPKEGEQQDKPNPLDSILTSDEKEKNLDTAMGGGLMSSALGATQELLQKYGQQAQSLEGAKAALKHEFQDTPELDAIITATQQELSRTRENRKQPGIGEFLTMALLNLSGMNPRNSADMVLGLGHQREDEMRLEDRLAQLEGSRAGAKMQGRQSMRAMEQHDKYQALQNALRQQETGRKQANENRDFGFKTQKLGFDKIMQRIGQLSQQVGLETDPARKKKLQDQIDQLDPYGKLRQQVQPPKDERQSRMFGDLLAGGGYA